VRIERTGAERVSWRIGQEYGEPHLRRRRGQFIRTPRISSWWKRDVFWLRFVAADVAMHYPADHKGPRTDFAILP